MDSTTLDLLDLPVTAPGDTRSSHIPPSPHFSHFPPNLLSFESGWTFSLPTLLNPDAQNPLPLIHHPGEASEGAHKPQALPPSTPQGQWLKKAMEVAAHAILAEAASLDAMDAKVGDGDCGSTLALGANRILADSSASVYQ